MKGKKIVAINAGFILVIVEYWLENKLAFVQSQQYMRNVLRSLLTG